MRCRDGSQTRDLHVRQRELAQEITRVETAHGVCDYVDALAGTLGGDCGAEGGGALGDGARGGDRGGDYFDVVSEEGLRYPAPVV